MATSNREPTLLEKAIHGDADALQELLFDAYDGLAARIARRVPTDLKAAVSAEDILQMTCADAFRSIGTFQPEGPNALGAWLWTIAKHRLEDAVRTERAAKRGGGRRAVGAGFDSTDSMNNLLAVVVGDDHTPSRSMARHEAERAVRVGIASLGEEYARVIELRYLRGLPVAEVARIMSRSERAIHNICYRAMKQLKAVMGNTSRFFTGHR